MRQAEGIFKEVRHLQDMFQDTSAERSDPRRYKIQLVEVS